MQYLVLLMLIFIAVAVILVLLPYVSKVIVEINNTDARIYTLYNQSVYMSGVWLVNGTTVKQIATGKGLTIEVAEGSYIYISNKTWSAMLSDNGDNGPIFSPYAVFNLTPGNYSYNIPTNAYDFEQPVYSVLSGMAFFFAAAIIFVIFMVLSYSRRR